MREIGIACFWTAFGNRVEQIYNVKVKHKTVTHLLALANEEHVEQNLNLGELRAVIFMCRIEFATTTEREYVLYQKT